MAAVLHRSPNDRDAATHLQKPVLGDVPKFPLVSMECGGRRRSCHDGRIPSTQALCEPATIVASDLAMEPHSPRGRPFVLLHRPGLRGFLLLAPVYLATSSLGLAAAEE